MARKRGGRAGEGAQQEEVGGDSKPTKTIRVYEDLADLILFVATREKRSVADLLDPLLRDEILARSEKQAALLQQKLRERDR